MVAILVRRCEVTPSQSFKKQMHDLIQEVLDEADVWKCCLNCSKFVEVTEVCLLCTPPARPPARVITFGCPAFDEVDSETVYQLKQPEPPKASAQALPQYSQNIKAGFDDDIPF
jgi:hypothetical protein